MLRRAFSTLAVSAFFIGVFSILITGCAHHRKLPKWEKPIAKTEFQTIRTTAYTHTESDHVAYGNHNALGTTLLAGPINSASADWSRWPAGTLFRILPTGETYVVDDYGWALAGTNTIDLYKPTRFDMNNWGVRRVDIQILQWGDPRESYRLLERHENHAHIKRMLQELRGQI